VTGTVLFTVLALAAPADDLATDASERPSSIFLEALRDQSVVRGQSPAVAEPSVAAPVPYSTFYQTPTYAPNGTVAPGTIMPYSGGAMPMYGDPYTSDPWLGGAPMGGGMMSPYSTGGSPWGAGTDTYGLNGPQPYRFGWTARHDIAFITESGTSTGGDLGVFEYNWEKEYVAPVWSNWVFSIAPQYNLRLYDGPFSPRPTAGVLAAAPAGSELPGNAHRFGLGLKLATPTVGGWTFEGGFNPSIVTDFESDLSGDSILYDAHAVAFWRWDRQWMWALGAAYWDRVDDIVIPYAGAVWTPNDYVEFRLLFPKPRVSFFLGTPFGLPTWFYVQGEYHVEAYEIAINGPQRTAAGTLVGVGDTRVQLADWRVVGGLYTEGQWATAFIEAGAVLGREVEYDGPVRAFDVDNGFILRMGFRW
jgi:hypothetical protein